MTPGPPKRREMQILLTDGGCAYAKSFLEFLYRAEDHALQKTIGKYSNEFIQVMEFFGAV